MDKSLAKHHIKQLIKMRRDPYCAELRPQTVDAEEIFLTIDEIDVLIDYLRKIVEVKS